MLSAGTCVRCIFCEIFKRDCKLFFAKPLVYRTSVLQVSDTLDLRVLDGFIRSSHAVYTAGLQWKKKAKKLKAVSALKCLFILDAGCGKELLHRQHWERMENAAQCNMGVWALSLCNLFKKHTLHVNTQHGLMLYRTYVCAKACRRNDSKDILLFMSLRKKMTCAQFGAVVNSFCTKHNKNTKLLARGSEDTGLLVTSGWERQKICFISDRYLVWWNKGKNEFEYISMTHCYLSSPMSSV